VIQNEWIRQNGLKKLYTALSRTRKIEFIHINNKELNNKYVVRKEHHTDLVNNKFNSVYQNGKIYKVTFDNCDNAPSNDKTLENVEKRSEITLGKNGSIVKPIL